MVNLIYVLWCVPKKSTTDLRMIFIRPKLYVFIAKLLTFNQIFKIVFMRLAHPGRYTSRKGFA